MESTEKSNLIPNTSVNEHSPSSVPTENLLDLLQLIAKRSRMIFWTTFVGAILSVMYCLTMPNIYTAKTMILPSSDEKGMMSGLMAQLGNLANLAGGTGFSLGGPTIADLYVSILKTDAIRDPVIDRLKLLEVYKSKLHADVSKTLEGKVIISSNKKDGIVTIQVDDKNPKLAADIANSYVEELGKLLVKLNETGAGNNRSFLEDRLAKARLDLSKAEDRMKEFQLKNKAVQISSQAEASIKGVAEMRARLALQEVQLSMARQRFTETSQEVKTLAASIAGIRAQIYRLEGTSENSSIPSVGSVPGLGQEYLRRMREFKIQESLVEVLTKQYEIAKLSEARNISPIQVIQKAKIPERKSKPKKSQLVIIATFMFFSVSLFMAFILGKISIMTDMERERWKKLLLDLFFFIRVKDKVS